MSRLKLHHQYLKFYLLLLLIGFGGNFSIQVLVAYIVAFSVSFLCGNYQEIILLYSLVTT